MAHEQSETIERDGRYFNVYGHALPQAGQTLPNEPLRGYSTLEEAVNAAKARSESFRNHERRLPVMPFPYPSSDPTPTSQGLGNQTQGPSGLGGIAALLRSLPPDFLMRLFQRTQPTPADVTMTPEQLPATAAGAAEEAQAVGARTPFEGGKELFRRRRQVY